MEHEELSHLEKERCKLEIKIKKEYFGSFVTNILNEEQLRKLEKWDSESIVLDINGDN
ncbi:hypothetical protein [Enterococcus sp. AZ072]|uniref:hypothetical protein n=1 Tax=unclassified Enterococcus TaxID=2608891 RepID=UPI003D272760